MSTRTLRQVIESVPTSDGAGVKLRRSLGKSQGERLDPFLMLDEFFSDNPDDYLAGYRDIPAAQIPVVDLPGGGRAKVIAGTLMVDGRATPGPMQGLSTDPLYLDVELPAGARFSHPVKPDYNAFLYTYEGGVEVGPVGNTRPLKTHSAGVLSAGDSIEIKAPADGARVILLAGRPLREPIVQHGPFVMNTRDEIEQAIRDYQSGTLTHAG